MLNVRALQSTPRVALGTPPALEPDVLARVEQIWQQEKKLRGDQLFNGAMFSVQEFSEGEIIGCMTEYRLFLAQRRDPALYEALKIRPLAVTGVLACRDGLVLGQRSSRTEMDANLWELVPSGSVDAQSLDDDGQPSLLRCLLNELREETGILASNVLGEPSAIAAADDSASHVVDIGLGMRIDLSAGQVIETFAALKNREYASLEVIAADGIEAFRKNRGASLADVSAALLKIVNDRP
jgi:8-oxo-dGTP pyrophosphatase MutT (NUDIX family)